MPKAKIYYHDIGDYLSREEKLSIIEKLGSTKNVDWQELTPNEHGDWISVRNEGFGNFIAIEPEKKFDLKTLSFFNTYAIGVASNRDAWVYNFSKNEIEKNMNRMIDFYNQQREAYLIEKQKNGTLEVEDFISKDASKISWTRALRNDLGKNIKQKYYQKEIIIGLYRPFFKQNLYFQKAFIESPGLSSKLFPNSNFQNKVICLTGISASKDFSLEMTNCIPDLQVQFNGQCFPLYYYEENKKEQTSLFDNHEEEFVRRDGISDFILAEAQKVYGNVVGKEDIFYYVYGFLHSPSYRSTFAADLKKMLPRIPLVETAKDFWAFSKAGRQLAELHINYETVAPAEGVVVKGAESGNFLVDKMRFPSKEDKSKIFYNSQITIENIPAEAYEYIVNGKSAIEWIMERYQITINKDSQIRNNPNHWAEEVGNPRYILDLLLSIIRVSIETVGIVKGLPEVGF